MRGSRSFPVFTRRVTVCGWQVLNYSSLRKRLLTRSSNGGSRSAGPYTGSAFFAPESTLTTAFPKACDSFHARVLRQMSPLFQRILCPVDFDDQCAAALDLARKIAEQTCGRVCALHVLSIEAEAERGWQKGATIQLKKIVESRLHGKIDYEFVERVGSAAGEVLDAAAEFGSDLIVIPTHRRVGLKRLVLGSIAERVIRESSIPVLTVRTS